MKILVDEHIPLMTVQALRLLNHDVRDIRGTPDEGIQDDALWMMAQREERLLITTDRGFSQYRTARHYGESWSSDFDGRIDTGFTNASCRRWHSLPKGTGLGCWSLCGMSRRAPGVQGSDPEPNHPLQRTGGQRCVAAQWPSQKSGSCCPRR